MDPTGLLMMLGLGLLAVALIAGFVWLCEKV
jgi:hypothetical protein